MRKLIAIILIVIIVLAAAMIVIPEPAGLGGIGQAVQFGWWR